MYRSADARSVIGVASRWARSSLVLICPPVALGRARRPPRTSKPRGLSGCQDTPLPSTLGEEGSFADRLLDVLSDDRRSLGLESVGRQLGQQVVVGQVQVRVAGQGGDRPLGNGAGVPGVVTLLVQALDLALAAAEAVVEPTVAGSALGGLGRVLDGLGVLGRLRRANLLG